MHGKNLLGLSIQLTCFNSLTEKEKIASKKNFAKKVSFFIEELENNNINFDVQLSKGLDIDGGCGQFSAKP